MPKAPGKVWIVIPAFNEETYLEKFLRKLAQVTPNSIVVDDGSQDATFDIAQHHAAYTLRHRLNLGKGAALRTGCRFAFEELGAEAVVIMDGDDQHDPFELPEFFQALADGHEVVFGIRKEPKNMPWLKLKINRLSSFITALLFGQYIIDIPSGYKAFSKAAYQKLAWEASNYAVELEIAAKTAKYKIPFTTVCIKTIYHDMNKGFSALDILSMCRHMLKLKVTL